MDDEAVMVYGSQRVLLGEMPYRDWATHLSPGSFFVGALWFAVWGFFAPAPRLLFAFLFSLTALLVEAASRRVLPRRWNLLPVFLWVSCGAMEFPILSYHWLASACTMGALLTAFDWVEKQGRGQALALGACLATCGWVLQSAGLVATLMVVFLWLRFRPANLHWVFLGTTIFSLILWLPVISSLPLVIEQNLSLRKHLAFNHKPYSLSNWNFFLAHYQGLSIEHGWMSFTAALSHIWINALRYLLTPALWLVTLVLCERRKDRAGLVLLYALLAWALGTANRHTPLYVSFLSPGWVILVAKFCQGVPRGYWLAAALAGAEVVGWGSRWWVRKHTYVYPISTRQGVYYSSDVNEARGMEMILNWLKRLPPKTEIFCFPYCVRFYTLCQFRNPMPRQTLLPLLDPPDVLSKSRQIVDQKQVEWLLYVGPDVSEIAGETGIPPAQIEQEWARLRDLLTEGYEQVQGSDGVGLYRRRPAVQVAP